MKKWPLVFAQGALAGSLASLAALILEVNALVMAGMALLFFACMR